MSDEPVDTSAEACAVVCMIVSNPQGTMRQDGDGWQKRVNDLIRALRDERTNLQLERSQLRREVDTLIAKTGRLHSDNAKLREGLAQARKRLSQISRSPDDDEIYALVQASAVAAAYWEVDETPGMPIKRPWSSLDAYRRSCWIDLVKRKLLPAIEAAGLMLVERSAVTVTMVDDISGFSEETRVDHEMPKVPGYLAVNVDDTVVGAKARLG